MDTECLWNLITRVREKVENGGRDRTDAATGRLIQTQPGTQHMRIFRPSADAGNTDVGVAEDVDVGVRHR